MVKIEEKGYYQLIEALKDDFKQFSIDQKKLRYFLEDQNLTLFELSSQSEDGLLKNRVSFFVWRRVNNEEKVRTVRRFINKAGFEEYFNLINSIATLITITVKTALYPIHIVGFRLSRGVSIDQLKVYYMIYTFTSKEDIMGSLNKEQSREAIVRILKELDIEEKADVLLRAMEIMESSNHQLEFIGLNIEKEKKPSLKLYFKPSKTWKMEEQ